LFDQFVVNFFNSNDIQLANKGGGILPLCNGIRIFKIGLRYSFICQGNSTKRQLERRDIFGFRVKLPPVSTSLSTHRQKQSP